MQQLQKHWGELKTLNARELSEQAPLLLAEFQQQALIVNQNMLLGVDGRRLQGPEVLQLLASLNEPSWRNRLWLYWFQSAVKTVKNPTCTLLKLQHQAATSGQKQVAFCVDFFSGQHINKAGIGRH